ncbi:primase-helicase family protein [Rubrivivax albus]|uniref:Uncharacterized protein n=1 Tax=Rubrivivax albus TaxID=2499835 RepID=A0A3S2U1T7_9BURK|nr:primase-helicase family protein [Rubrivivax albus]RVT50348.1 hypothetical protein ENE75_15120 [Rubrivivax albus]
MKGLITEPTLVIEGKHKDARGGVPNRLKLMVLSNYDWVVPAGADERRYCVIDVPGDRAQDQGYFGKLNAWLDADGARIFLHYLLNRDLSGFNPRVAPRTAALDAQKIAAMSAVDRWLLEALDTGILPRYHLPAAEWSEAGVELRCDEAVGSLAERGVRLRSRAAGKDAREIGKRLQQVFGCGPAAARAGQQPAERDTPRPTWRAWSLPGLTEARARAAKAFGLTYYAWGQA